MYGTMRDATAPDPYAGSTHEHYRPTGPDLLDRWMGVARWLEARADVGVLPYCKVNGTGPGPRTSGVDTRGRPLQGVNFANQDYLSLARHPLVAAAAHQAVDACGVHSAGSSALMGLTGDLVALEHEVARFVACRTATVFPIGWGAGYGVIRALVRPRDHVVIDVLAHACLHEGATSATANVHRFAHLSTDGAARRLARIRESDPDAGILLVTESHFSMDADSPDLGALQLLAARHRATLLVDVAPDLGALGPTGRGALETQGMLGEVDVVMGSFSKTFAANGGFVASHHPALRDALRFGCGPQTFSNAMSPVQAAIVRAALDIVRGPEGHMRREQMLDFSLRLRAGLQAAGFECLGDPGPILPVTIGDDRRARRMTAAVIAEGGIVNLVEYPALRQLAGTGRPVALAFAPAYVLAALTPLLVIVMRHQIRADRVRQIELFAEAFDFEPRSSPRRRPPLVPVPGENCSFEFVRAKYFADLDSAVPFDERTVGDLPRWPMMIRSDWTLLFSAVPCMLLAGWGLTLLLAPRQELLEEGRLAQLFPPNLLGIGGSDTRVGHEPVLTVAAYAFAGAYLFTLRQFVRSLIVFDLSPATFLRAFAHMLAAVTIAIVIFRASPGDAGTLAPLWLALAFALGFLPDAALDRVLRLARVVHKARYHRAETHCPSIPLTVLDGIDAATAFRLGSPAFARSRTSPSTTRSCCTSRARTGSTRRSTGSRRRSCAPWSGRIGSSPCGR